jgi:hypothetical protein
LTSPGGIAGFLVLDWDEAPAELAFSVPFGSILEKLSLELGPLVAANALNESADPDGFKHHKASAFFVFTAVPAIVNVILNYKICVENGLPLHPTAYFDVGDRTSPRKYYPPRFIDEANALFREAIAVARSVYALSPEAPESLERFRTRIPAGLLSFVFTSVRDKYTWRASEPAAVEALAKKLKASVKPALIVGAAHGSLMAGNLLSLYLDCELYFIRYSVFKRRDSEPIVSDRDLAFFGEYADQSVVLFDEDVAGGGTLASFSARLSPLFSLVSTASVLCCAYSPFRPDYTVRLWYE